MNILVIAPHPDDEVLGVGGTIAKFVNEGNKVFVAIATKGYPPQFLPEQVQQCQQEAKAAHDILGVEKTIFLSLPAAQLDIVALREINHELVSLCQTIQPDILFIPFNGDLHLDHQQIFLSALVAARPNHSNAPKAIYAYETLSETNWNAPYLTPSFVPNVFIDISAYLNIKLQAMNAYASQVQASPHERSIESLKALATLRGSTVYCQAAEAFVLIRQLIPS